MRKLVYAINISADGCCEHDKSGGGSEDILDHYTKMLGDVGLLIYGRVTYQLMVPYWPDVAKNESASRAEKEFARAFCAVDRVVFSRTLGHAAEEKTRIVGVGVREEILRLKAEPGKEMLVGGVALPSQLIEMGLVDEFRIVVNPILVGKGRRLLEGTALPERLGLKLVESKVFPSGCVSLRYAKGGMAA
jgi:dihydrofolate reductase